MRLLICALFLSACSGQRTEIEKPPTVVLAPGSESIYGQCGGEYNLDLSQKKVDFTKFVDADYDNQMQGRIIVNGDNGRFVGCRLNSGQCSHPNVVHTWKSGNQTCVETQHCCNLQ